MVLRTYMKIWILHLYRNSLMPTMMELNMMPRRPELGSVLAKEYHKEENKEVVEEFQDILATIHLLEDNTVMGIIDPQSRGDIQVRNCSSETLWNSSSLDAGAVRKTSSGGDSLITAQIEELSQQVDCQLIRKLWWKFCKHR